MKEVPKWISEFRINDIHKGYTEDLDKVVPPSSTIANARKCLARFGDRILRGTLRIDSNRLGIPVYFSICGIEAESTIGTKKQMGKGGSPEQAEASALMELVERFSLFSFVKGLENFENLTFKEIRDLSISIEEIKSSVGDPAAPGEIIDAFAELPMSFIWAYDITKERPVVVPFEWFWMINEYNGSSSGNVREEAILQGICEVVERHVSAIVATQSAEVPGVEISNLEDKKAIELVQKYRDAGVRLYLSDFSMNTGIPTIGALAYDPSTFPERSEIVWTAGTTTSPSKSLIRALTEVAQLAGDFDTAAKYVASGLPKPKTLREVEHVINPKEFKSIEGLPDISHNNLRVEIERIVSSLSRIGLSVILIDITNHSLDIPCFYTIIPGALFRERTQGKMGLFVVKLISEKFSPEVALEKIRQLNKCLKREHYIYFYEAELLRRLGRYEDSLKSYDLSLSNSEMTFDKFLTLTYKAIALMDAGLYEKAIEALGKALQMDKETAEIYTLLGNCYYRMGEYKEAIDQFMKALLINPGSAIDYANIATNYARLGKKDDAINYYNMALRIDPFLEYAKEGLNGVVKSSG